jgi:hypothetical protein
MDAPVSPQNGEPRQTPLTPQRTTANQYIPLQTTPLSARTIQDSEYSPSTVSASTSKSAATLRDDDVTWDMGDRHEAQNISEVPPTSRFVNLGLNRLTSRFVNRRDATPPAIESLREHEEIDQGKKEGEDGKVAEDKDEKDKDAQNEDKEKPWDPSAQSTYQRHWMQDEENLDELEQLMVPTDMRSANQQLSHPGPYWQPIETTKYTIGLSRTAHQWRPAENPGWATETAIRHNRAGSFVAVNTVVEEDAAFEVETSQEILGDENEIDHAQLGDEEEFAPRSTKYTPNESEDPGVDPEYLDHDNYMRHVRAERAQQAELAKQQFLERSSHRTCGGGTEAEEESSEADEGMTEDEANWTDTDSLSAEESLSRRARPIVPIPNSEMDPSDVTMGGTDAQPVLIPREKAPIHQPQEPETAVVFTGGVKDFHPMQNKSEATPSARPSLLATTKDQTGQASHMHNLQAATEASTEENGEMDLSSNKRKIGKWDVLKDNIAPPQLGQPAPEKLSIRIQQRKTGKLETHTFQGISTHFLNWDNEEHIRAISEWPLQIFRSRGLGLRKPGVMYSPIEDKWLLLSRRKLKAVVEAGHLIKSPGP